MKKTVYCLILVCFVIFSAQTAIAGTKCYNWSPFGDVLKVTVTTQDPKHPANKLLTGALYYPGLYYLPFTGTLVKDADGVSKRFSIHLTNNTTSFDGFNDCVIDATLGTTNPIQGPVEIECGAGGFTGSGTLIQIDCSTLPAPTEPLRVSEDALPAGGE